MLRHAMTPRHAVLLFLSLAAAGLTSGCGRPEDPVWVNPQPKDMAVRPPVFCYRTLDRPDCYATPQPGPPNRIVGSAPVIVLSGTPATSGLPQAEAEHGGRVQASFTSAQLGRPLCRESVCR